MLFLPLLKGKNSWSGLREMQTWYEVQSKSGIMQWLCLSCNKHATYLGLGLNSSVVFWKWENYYFDSGKETLVREHVCIAFTKPAGLALQALKSLFTVEQSEILVALKSATPWSETLKCTVQVDGLLRWNDINLCYDSRIRHFTNVKWNKTTKGRRKPDWLQSE